MLVRKVDFVRGLPDPRTLNVTGRIARKRHPEPAVSAFSMYFDDAANNARRDSFRDVHEERPMPNLRKEAVGRTSSILAHAAVLAGGSALWILLSGCSGGSLTSCASCGGNPPPQPIATILTLTAPAGPLVQGQAVQFTITVNPAPPTGAEIVRIDDVTGSTSTFAEPMNLATGTLRSGTIALTVEPPTPGIRTYTATYVSDGEIRGNSGTDGTFPCARPMGGRF